MVQKNNLIKNGELQMVKKLLISLSLILGITPIHTMWSGLAQRVGVLSRIAPARSLRDYAWIKGLTLKEEKKESASPVAGAAFLEGPGVQIYKGVGPLSNFTKKVGHVLDDRFRLTALPGNAFSSATPYYLGVLNKAFMEDTVDEFIESETAQEWYDHHCATKRDTKKSSWNRSIRQAVKAGAECKDEVPRVLAALAVAQSEGPEGLQDYAKGLDVDVVPQKFSKAELKEPNIIDIAQVNAHFIKRSKSDVSFLSIPLQYFGYKGQRDFPVCGEDAVWTVLNFVFYNPETGEFDTDLIPQDIVLHPEFKAFLEKYPAPQNSDYVEKSKEEWMNFISDVPSLKYLGGKNYELSCDSTTGLEALKYCLGITDVSSFSELAKKLSTPERTITISDAYQAAQTVKVSFEYEDETYDIDWVFQGGHADASVLTAASSKLTPFDVGMAYVAHTQNPAVGVGGISAEDLVKEVFNAIEINSFERVQTFIKMGADLNKECDGYPPLPIAVRSGRFEIAKLLLEHGAEVDKVIAGYTSLFGAVRLGHFEIVKLLLEHGAEVDKECRDYTPLYVAFLRGRLEEAELLLQHGADVNQSAGGSKDTIFDEVVKAKNKKLVKIFIEHSACPNNIMNEYALNQNTEELKFLLTCGVNPNLAMEAAISGQRMVGYNLDIIDILLDHGADPEYFLQYIDYLDKAEPEFINHGSDIDKRQNIIDLLNDYSVKVPWEMIKDSYRNADGLYPGTKQLIRDAGMVPASEAWEKIQQKAC